MLPESTSFRFRLRRNEFHDREHFSHWLPHIYNLTADRIPPFVSRHKSFEPLITNIVVAWKVVQPEVVRHEEFMLAYKFLFLSPIFDLHARESASRSSRNDLRSSSSLHQTQSPRLSCRININFFRHEKGKKAHFKPRGRISFRALEFLKRIWKLFARKFLREDHFH